MNASALMLLRGSTVALASGHRQGLISVPARQPRNVKSGMREVRCDPDTRFVCF